MTGNNIFDFKHKFTRVMVGEDNNSSGKVFDYALQIILNANIDYFLFEFSKVRIDILRNLSHDEVGVHNGTLHMGIKVFISKNAYTFKGDQDEIIN